MMTECPNCESEMKCTFGETVDLVYYRPERRTRWTITEVWVCYNCTGDMEDDEE